ncbi:hypothetical protein EDB89DRAFT_2070070 [Lactarius sanguifluus]|nr:hypothetical protein EDB89DRAFT_2070070 [Lactarius sanguifluus]
MSSKCLCRPPPSPTPGPHQKHAKYEHRDTPTGSEFQQFKGTPPGDQLSIHLITAEVMDERDIDGKLILIHTFVKTYIDSQGSGNNIFFFELVSKATGPGANDDDREALLQHDTFWVASSSSSQPKADERIASRKSQGQAVVCSWTTDFVGKGLLQALEKHSSGMGKSHLLDEFSKEHFLIPSTCARRIAKASPTDDEVRKFLTNNQEYQGRNISKSSYMRAHYFLKALFCVTTETITKLDAPSEGGAKRTYHIDKFRIFMSYGQSMGSSRIQRVNFYREVVDKAKEDILSDILSDMNKLSDEDQSCESELGDKSKLDEKKHDKNLIDAFESLRCLINDDSPSMEVLRLPDVFLVVLSDESLFTFFLSTTGKISQFSPPHGRDASHRMNDGKLKTPTPFIYLGFDQLMRDRKVFDKYKTLNDVTSLECIAHMGRPLWGTTYDHGNEEVRCGLVHFASLKLLCGTFPDKLSEAQNRAVLSQQLPLDINSTIYAPLPSDQVEKEQEQISNHMLICMSIGDGIDTIRGIATSEPILAEVASIIMKLLVTAFFTWARDTAAAGLDTKFPGQLSRYFSVVELFSSLFSKATYKSMSEVMPSLSHATPAQTFGQVFGHARMHFNHFIKPHQWKVLTRPYLLAFITHGTAAFGATGQLGFDAVYPFLYGGTDLDVDKVGFIIVQVKKNDTSEAAQDQIFKKMDPFACDFPDKWIAMANKADSWRLFYNGSLDPSVLRSQAPGSGLDPSHFDSWSTPISESEDLF